MRSLLVGVSLAVVLLGLALLPLIPDLSVLRQALIGTTGLAAAVLLGVNGVRRFQALPDLRGRIVASSTAAILLLLVGALGSLALSLPGGLGLCSVRAVRLAETPTGYDALVPGRTTWRFSRHCPLDDTPERWFRQSVLVFLVGEAVPDQG